MNLSGEIIDAQVNFGRSANGPNSDFSVYEKEAEKLGITGAVLMSTPAHIIQTAEGEETSCLWQVIDDPGKRYVKTVRTAAGGEQTIYNPVRPYHEANRQVLEFVRAHNAQRKKLQLFFAAKIHPILDDEHCIDDFVSDDLACLKVHGISTHSDPTIFPQWIADVARHHNLPILVHTDYYGGPIDDSMDPFLREHLELYRKNHALPFIQWAIHNRLRVAINHGASLDRESIRIVNNEENLMLVYGPDSLIELDKERLATPTDDYARTLFDLARPDKVMFSTDFAWNVNDRGTWQDMRWDSVERIRAILGKEDQEKVLSKNIRFFYKL